MTVTRFEVGIVAADGRAVDFLAEVFQLERLPPMDNPAGTLHRLQSPGAVIKVMVPSERPKPGDRDAFLAVTGIRYLSIWVTDLDGVVERCIGRGGALLHGPFEYEPGTRLAVVTDPDGNTLEVVEAASTEDVPGSD
jgi:predicted enzyme related to lactoylglutathione lyase